MIKILLIFQPLTGSDPLREWANNKDFSFFLHVEHGGFKDEVQHGIEIDETPLQAF